MTDRLRFLPSWTALAFILAAILVDQAIKAAVEATLPFNEAVPLIPMLALYRTHNYGVAFSMLSSMDGWFIVALRLVVVGFVLWLWQRTSTERRLAHIGYGMIIAGAIGNIIDRLLFGYVVDYVLFYTQTWSFAVFNMADSLISVGAGFILLDELKQGLSERKASKSSDR